MRTREFHRPPLPPAAEPEMKRARQWLRESSQPLFIEIGCGVGWHPIQWSSLHTAERLLAFERTRAKYEKARRRYLNHGSPANILIVHGDASILLPYLLAAATVSGFYFLYPNPYPKPKQANLRLPNSPFLNFVHELLIPGGSLRLATNSEQFAAEAVARIPARGFYLISDQILPADFPPRSHFEAKYLERSETCRDLTFQKR